ncbi:hypothetical protein GY45DRAFT_1070363 [Cubamyces sp. BRFM 1775]|nr:hypothetical protein GY45DRAFT_1070363 [Cubamyces sp. BRFM 1775]
MPTFKPVSTPTTHSIAPTPRTVCLCSTGPRACLAIILRLVRQIDLCYVSPLPYGRPDMYVYCSFVRCSICKARFRNTSNTRHRSQPHVSRSSEPRFMLLESGRVTKDTIGPESNTILMPRGRDQYAGPQPIGAANASHKYQTRTPGNASS